MDDAERCQSCGMPISIGFYGTNADESDNTEYCHYCYANGEFTEPNMTLDQMITRSMGHMVTELKMPEEQAKKLAEEFIPHLKRWQTNEE